MALSASTRMAVLFSGPCFYCADPVPTQVDHKIPRSRGGTDEPGNLVPACRGCNMEKLDFTPEEYRAYREERGLGWPPESRTALITRLVDEYQARNPGVDVRAAILSSLNRSYEARRAEEVAR